MQRKSLDFRRYVLTETPRSLGAHVEELNIYRSSICRHTQKNQERVAAQLKEEFKAGTPLIVHWDRKLVQDLTSKHHINRLPVLVSGKDMTQLLKVRMSFDSTASNTGQKNDACVLVEQLLENDLYFVCRHHVLELVVQTVFLTLLGPSSASEVQLFKRFQAK